jgi:hypothetical protein
MRALAFTTQQNPGAMPLAAGAMKSLGFCNDDLPIEFIRFIQA